MYRDVIEYLLGEKEIEDRREIFNTFFKDVDLTTYEKKINTTHNKKDHSRLKNTLVELSSIWLSNVNTPYTDPLEILKNPLDTIQNNDSSEYIFSRYVVSQKTTISHKDKNTLNASIIYTPIIIRFLSKVKQYFSDEELNNILQLENVISYRLYSYIKAKLSLQETKEIQISVEDLRTIFGVEDKYLAFRDFRKYILDKVIDDISKNLGENIRYSKVLLERKVTKISLQMD